jgi:hypothetical protein
VTRIFTIPPTERPGTERATIDSWSTHPAPAQRADLGFSGRFTGTEAEALKRGFIPREMEDKWFVCMHDGWLLFHRSWTGYCIYGLRLDVTPDGMKVSESWVSRDPEQYGDSDIEEDRKLVRHLIDELLLNRPVD